MHKRISLAMIDSALIAKLADRAAKALGMPPSEALTLPRATLVTILEEYAEYRARDERTFALEAKAICDGIFTREELAQLDSAAREEAHAALRILDVIDAFETPATKAKTSEAPRSWPSDVLVLVSKLVGVIASQEESLALIRSELEARGGVRESPTVALPLLPRTEGEEVAPTIATDPPVSIHSRDTLNSELKPLGASRKAAVEIEGLVSYISALGSLKNMPLPDLLVEPTASTRRR